jgi:hypothetical protein
VHYDMGVNDNNKHGADIRLTTGGTLRVVHTYLPQPLGPPPRQSAAQLPRPPRPIGCCPAESQPRQPSQSTSSREVCIGQSPHSQSQRMPATLPHPHTRPSHPRCQSACSFRLCFPPGLQALCRWLPRAWQACRQPPTPQPHWALHKQQTLALADRINPCRQPMWKADRAETRRAKTRSASWPGPNAALATYR